ncbi:MAG: ABC transporter ATP-binding protein [Candidatus Ratteibacteria bacterium]|nr:ABC transporter ATP-binding protein [Candidatus Ratteibacteria bacterium]
MTLYLRCLKYLKPYYKIIFISVICMIFYAFFNMVSIALLEPIINKALQGNGPVFFNISLINKSLQVSKLQFLGLMSCLIIAAYFLKGLCDYFQSYFTSYAGSRAIIDFRNEFYEHIQYQPMRFFTQKRVGELMSRIINDIENIQDSLTVIFSNVVKEPITIVALTIFLFKTNWRLSLIAMVAFMIAVYPLSRFGRRIKKIGYNKQKRMADVTNAIHESIAGIETVKIFGKEKEEAEKLAENQMNLFKFAMKKAKIKALAPPIMELVGAFGIATILLVGGMQVIRGTFDIGKFFAFVVGLSALYHPIKTLTQENNKIQASMGSAQRVFEILDHQKIVRDVPNAVEIPPFEKDIVFKNVSFSYSHRPILKNINLEVKKGEIVAIVGLSGVGKTTLVNLIPRFYDPVEGKIEIDGYDIKQVKLKSLRKQIAIVSQETFLFNDTIRANIAYGSGSKVTNEKIVEIAKAASAHEFIEKLANGYDTIVGERGMQLSGGQRQRISIARALLKNPSILILDEATSELDSEVEAVLQEALEKLMKGRTTFIIAHRLSTIVHADKIVVLGNNTIAEIGVHEELIKTDGVYKKLYQMQYKMRNSNP